MTTNNTTTTEVSAVQNPQAMQVTVSPAAPVTTETVPLTTVLRQIARDARRQPQDYLDQTTVPHGGE